MGHRGEEDLEESDKGSSAGQGIAASCGSAACGSSSQVAASATPRKKSAGLKGTLSTTGTAETKLRAPGTVNASLVSPNGQGSRPSAQSKTPDTPR